MLLSDNTKKVVDLIHKFDNLGNIDKVRLAIYLLENKNFSVDFNISDMIIISSIHLKMLLFLNMSGIHPTVMLQTYALIMKFHILEHLHQASPPYH